MKKNEMRSKAKRRHFKVRFNPYQSSIVYDHLPNEERKEMYCSSTDLESFRQEAQQALIESRKLGISPYHCLRGIEHLYSREISTRHRNTRKSHTRRVLLAQAIQNKENIRDAEEVKVISQLSSAFSCERAKMLAEKDSVDAQRIFAENLDCSSTKQLSQCSLFDIFFCPLPKSDSIEGFA